MGNGVSSPGDPLFWLHHTWLDKLLWDWQAKDRTKRTTTITGTNIGRDSAPGFPTRPSSIPYVVSFLFFPRGPSRGFPFPSEPGGGVLLTPSLVGTKQGNRRRGRSRYNNHSQSCFEHDGLDSKQNNRRNNGHPGLVPMLQVWGPMKTGRAS